MNGFDAVKEVAGREGRSLYSVSVAIGRNSNYLSAAASRGSSPSCSTMAEVLAECGWSLVAVPAGQEPEGSVRID